MRLATFDLTLKTGVTTSADDRGGEGGVGGELTRVGRGEWRHGEDEWHGGEGWRGRDSTAADAAVGGGGGAGSSLATAPLGVVSASRTI